MGEGDFSLTRRVAIQGSAAVLGTTMIGSPAMAAPAIGVGIDAARKSEPFNKYLFGALIEHIAGLINYSLWSEVLEDRKFYWAVDNQPVPLSAQRGPRAAAAKWTPLGPESAVVMDKSAPYVGEQSPVVALAASGARGIQQKSLKLAKKDYSGRIVIAGDGTSAATITLIWGEGAGQRQSVTVPLTAAWKTQALKFSCGAATTDGRIEIAAVGSGHLKIGAVSLMPADNIRGFRKDTITLLRDMNSGFYRWPGGNFVSGHDWRDAIGDPDKRPTIFDDAWKAPQPNDIGTDEFLVMCELLGTDPYICVDTGYGSAREAAQLVEYVNGDATTQFGAMRAANGHPEPYRVTWWNVGNEMYGYWQMGYMAPEHYMIKHNMVAKAMKKVDPSITIIAVGAMPDEMTVDECPYFIDPHTRHVVGKTVVDFASPNDWTYRLIQQCTGNFDIISEHCYGDAHRFDIPQGKILPGDVQESVLESCRRAANRIRLKREYWDQYVKAFPTLLANKTKVSVDEWGFRNARGVKQLMGFAMTLHEFFRNTDFITMAAFTMGMSWIDYNRTEATYSGAGLLFQMYQRHFGTIPVAVTGSSPQPAPKWPVGGDQPRVNAGSDTFPLDISAALRADGALTVAVVNATETAQPMALRLANFRKGSSGRVWRLTGTSLDAVNRVGELPEVFVKEDKFDPTSKSLAVAPYSVELYAFSAG